MIEDEEWTYYENTKCKKAWEQPGKANPTQLKLNIHSDKVIFRIWNDRI